LLATRTPWRPRNSRPWSQPGGPPESRFLRWSVAPSPTAPGSTSLSALGRCRWLDRWKPRDCGGAEGDAGTPTRRRPPTVDQARAWVPYSARSAFRVGPCSAGPLSIRRGRRGKALMAAASQVRSHRAAEECSGRRGCQYAGDFGGDSRYVPDAAAADMKLRPSVRGRRRCSKPAQISEFAKVSSTSAWDGSSGGHQQARSCPIKLSRAACNRSGCRSRWSRYISTALALFSAVLSAGRCGFAQREG